MAQNFTVARRKHGLISTWSTTVAPAREKNPDRAEKGLCSAIYQSHHVSLLSAINVGNAGTKRPHQAEISTTGRYTFAGQVTRPKFLLSVGILPRGGSFPADPNQLLGYLQEERPPGL